MNVTLIGKLEHKAIGLGSWVLITSEGTTYELKNSPAELLKVKGKVKITGKTRDDLMSLSMLGTILEVKSFEVVN